jgi:AcrR family transcriptional regulator
LFSQRGFRGTTTRELAAAVGVSEPVLYQHFPSKRDLYTAIIEHVMAKDETQRELFRMVEEATGEDLHGFFIQLANAALEWHQSNEDYVRLIFFSALENHELADLAHNRHKAVFTAVIEGFIARQVAEGRIRDLSPSVVTEAFMGMLGDYCKRLVLFRKTCTALPPEVAIPEMVNIFLRGISKPEKES